MVQRAERLISLDAFRGITIAGMILVNNPGNWSHVYPPLLHADWHGWTPTDLVFPFFLFIVGVAMTYSFNSMLDKGVNKRQIYKKVFIRSLLLFGIGLCMTIFPVVRFEPLRLVDFSTLRIMGVLQRIGLCYLFASIIYLEFRKPVYQATWVVGLLASYWAVMMLIPVPGYGAGDLTIKGNLAAYVDQSLMGNHLWKPGWDPEGLLSTIPAIATVLLGILTGYLLKSSRHSKAEKAGYLFLAGIGGLTAGLIADFWFPINKGLWSSSYVLFTGGFAMVFLAFCYWVIDIKQYKKWAKPFVILGMNALAVFVFSSLLAKLLYLIPLPSAWGAETVKDLIYTQLLLPLASPVNASLLFAVFYLLFWTWMMYLLYKRKIFIKI